MYYVLISLICLIGAVASVAVIFIYSASKSDKKSNLSLETIKLPYEPIEYNNIEVPKQNENTSTFSKFSYSEFPEGYTEATFESDDNNHIHLISEQMVHSSFSLSLDKKLLVATDNEDTTPKEFTAIISADPTLSAKVLQIANSPYFGFIDEVTSIFRAVVLMGNTSVKSAITQYMLKKNTHRLNDHQQKNFSYQWKHSTITSAIARYLSMVKFSKINDDPTTIALLHNIGKYHLFMMDPEYKTTGGLDLIMEEKKYGFNHAQLGEAICQKWDLPDSISQTIKYHHYPSFADIEDIPEEIRFNVTIIYLSTIITDIFLKEPKTPIYPMKDCYFQYLQIDSDVEKMMTPALITEINKANSIIDALSL